MGNSWNWKQSLAFFMIFLPATFFYALQKNSFKVDGSTLLRPPAHWLQETYDVFTQQLQETLNIYISLVGTNRENKKLKVENAQLASKLQLLEEYRSENIRLRDLFKFKQELPRKTIAARVISKDILAEQNSIVIDKGSDQGVERLQGVISAKGVVGYVVDVEADSSRVLLLTDRGASVDAIIQRTRARGIVSGVSSSLFQLKYIVREEDAQPDDVVVTSGRQGHFPKGFMVGHIRHVGPSPTGVSYHAQVVPAVPIERLENVLVIIEQKGEMAAIKKMKKTSISLFLFLSFSFFLSGIQASLYFLPISLPYFWFIILTYYSFKKSLQFSLVCNLLHIFVISQFSSIGISSLLINMNLISLFFLILRDRFHIGLLQMSLSSGVGCLFFLINSWFLSSMVHGFYWPSLWSWIGSSLMTIVLAPIIIPILSFFDQRIHIERIDTLENLRI